VVLTLALAACTSSQTVVLTTTTTTTVATTKPLPAVDASATPGGWMPVAFGDAQISVPSTWRVLYNSSECPTGSPQGEVLVNPQLAICRNEGAGSQGPKTMVWLNLLTKLGSGYKHRTVISGFSVYDDLGTYFVPSLRLQFGASLKNSSGLGRLTARGQLLMILRAIQLFGRGRARRFRDPCSHRMSRPRETHRCRVGRRTQRVMGTRSATSRRPA
jgi:hypothetical protein